MVGELMLVGSLPCQTAEETFRIFGHELGQWLSFMPDGEVGYRRYWIDGTAYRVFTTHPEIETVKRPAPTPEGVEKWTPAGRHDEFGFRVKPGIDKVRFGDPGWRLGFARDAANSYAIFRLLKQVGVLPEHLRFQVCIPLTHSQIEYFFPAEDLEKLIDGYNEALRAEVAKICELIPHDELAIQWDLAIEQRLVELALPHGQGAAEKEAARIMEPAAVVCADIPKEVRVGHHMCFGTLSGWPSRQPEDLTGAVLLSNAAIEGSGRQVDFVHIPTLGSAADDFFRPMKMLKHDGVRVYMGTIHHLHGSGGMEAQLRTIKKYLPEFGIAAPCGFGRAPDRPGRLLTDDGTKVPDYLDIILRDHKAAMETYAKVMTG